MMQSLRDNMKLIIWITAIVFLVGFGILELGGVLDWNAQSAPRGVIARINGEPIRYEDFMRLYNQMTEELTRQRPMQQGEDSYVREQAWQQIVRAKLMEQEAKRRHIEVTPEEIKAAIRFTPPDFLMRAPAFQTNGQFDYRKYLSEVENPNSQLPWNQVEAIVASQLPAQKLQEEITAEAKVSEADVRERFLLQNEKIRMSFLAFFPDSFAVDTAQIGGADIESYYKAHPEEFTGPEEVKVQVIRIPRKPSPADFAAVRERLVPIWEQLKAEPDSFESYARTYSEIASASGGGNAIGEPIIENMRPAFRNVLRNLKAGDISPIVQEERSLHIFRVDKIFPDTETGTGKPRIHYHEIALRVQPGPETVRVIRSQITDIVKAANREGLGPVAARRGFELFNSGYFAEGKSGNSIFEQFPEVELWLFKAKVGSISRPVPSEGGWFLYQIADRRKPGLRPIAAVQPEAKVALIRSLKVARATEAAKEARAAVLAGMKPEEAATRFRGYAGAEMEVTRNGIMGPLGRSAKAAGTLFMLPAQSWSPILSGENSVFTAYIAQHTTPSEEEYQRQVATLRQGLLNERRRMAFVEWFQEVRRKAKIEDYRDSYFEA